MSKLLERSIQIDMPVLLPEVGDSQDGCLARLETALQQRRGIQRVHMKRDEEPVKVCLHYDPNQISLQDVRTLAQRTGARIANRYHHRVLPIEGMDCSDCALVVEHSLSRMDGVLGVSVNYAAQTMHIEYDSHHVNRRAITKRVSGLGYQVPSKGWTRWYHRQRELIFSFVAGLALFAAWAGERFLGFPFGLSLGLYAVAYILAGYDVTRHAIGALKARQFDTDLLMLVAAFGAAILGDFTEGALLLFLFSLGHALEHRSLDHARSAIRSLANLTPVTALVQRDGNEIEVPVDRISIGETVIVKPGVRIPVDGEVIAGTSSVNQAPVTGESLPNIVSPEDKVYAGSINGEGLLQVRTIRLARDSTLARVARMVERAQAQKSPTQQFTERFTRVFVPAILIGDLLLILLPPLFGVPFRQSFLMAMTVLVAASPCALVLAAPAAVLSGVAQAARNGVLVKGGAHLENLGRIQAIAFDKTGTITLGQPEVTDVVSFQESIEESDVLCLAAAVENRSAHPLAEAILRRAQDLNLQIPESIDAVSITGRGAKAIVDGYSTWVGSLSLFTQKGPDESEGISIPDQAVSLIDALQTQGKTAMLVSKSHEVIGLIAVADVVREDVRNHLQNLKLMGIQHAIMLTGDNAQTARYIATQVGLDEVLSNLLPEDKLAAVQDLVNKHRFIAMVGDGVNDAPALAHATVGIAMGGAATDVALEAADVALMANDLSKLPFAVGLGRASQAIIRQNLLISLSVIVGLIGLTLSGLTGIGIAILLHEGSTVLVALNALRLLRYRPRLVV
jgi:Cd2+/Zn2+-exporting ATPase